MARSCPARAGPPPTAAPTWSVADVLRAAWSALARSHSLRPADSKVLGALVACRTGALGGHLYQCAECGRQHLQPHCCRNRHCPTCQGAAAAQWLDQQQARLLPIPYFHVVFTLPHKLNPLVRQNRVLLYDLLFSTASQTLQEFGQRHFGGQIGLTAVLHTWGQNLLDHYHLHCVVTGGALVGRQWISGHKRFLFPVRALSEVFRAKFRDALWRLFNHGRLEFHGALAPLAQRAAFAGLVCSLLEERWVVYSKRPFAGPQAVLAYLSRYTHRVAISNKRILKLDPDLARVTFRYKDYRDHSRVKQMTLDIQEFARRFLLHVLPDRFVKIRHYGLFANRGLAERMAALRQLLGSPFPDPNPAPCDPHDTLPAIEPRLPVCPFCGAHALTLIRVITSPCQPSDILIHDSS